LVENGGNPELRPERAKAFNVGIRLAPQDWPRVSVLLNYFHISVSNHIDSLDLPADVLSNPEYRSFVYRNYTDAQREQACTHGTVVGGLAACLQTPIIALVDLRLQNIESVETSGFDWISRAKSVTPTSSTVDVLNTTHEPLRWRWRSSLDWSLRPLWVSAAVNHQGGYRNTDLGLDSRVGPWTTVDLVLGCRLGPDVLPSVPRTRISINAFNVFGSTPPVVFSSTGVAYDQENGSLAGRRVSLTLQYQW
jgi:iron complex outermembrane recepter protein